MNTTKNISIGGYAFIIEEDAYIRLGQYINAVKTNLVGTPGSDEVVADIEMRIAEIFREVLKGREVVSDADVSLVISRMGEPDVYRQDAAGDQSSGTGSDNYTGEVSGEKRIFRDMDNKIIGGVASGLGAYFNVDQVWFRLAFVGMFFLYGSSFWLYIILWVVIPAAKTRTQKLQMRGQRPDLKNIENSIREELNDVGDRISRMANGEKVSTAAENVSSALGIAFTRFFEVLLVVLRIVLKIFVGFVGFLALGFLVFLVFMMVSGISSIEVVGDEVNVRRFSGVVAHIFSSPVEGQLFYFFLFMFLAIPAVGLLANAIRYLAGVESKMPKWVGLVSVGLWLMATAGLMYLGVKTALGFSKTFEGKTELPLLIDKERTLYLKLGEQETGKNTFTVGDIQLDIRESETDKFWLKLITKSSGSSVAEANQNQQKIHYMPVLKDSALVFPPLISLNKGDLFRKQEVKMELYVPQGGKIFLGSGMGNIIYDVQNVQDMEDSKMIQKKWIMTEEGLSCEGCDILPTSSGQTKSSIEITEPDGKAKIRINVHEI